MPTGLVAPHQPRSLALRQLWTSTYVCMHLYIQSGPYVSWASLTTRKTHENHLSYTDTGTHMCAGGPNHKAASSHHAHVPIQHTRRAPPSTRKCGSSAALATSAASCPLALHTRSHCKCTTCSTRNLLNMHTHTPMGDINHPSGGTPTALTGNLPAVDQYIAHAPTRVSKVVRLCPEQIARDTH